MNKNLTYLPPVNLAYHDLINRIYPELWCKQITFQVTEDCCLQCSYCYQHHKTKNKMTFSTVKKFIDELLTDQIDFFTKENTSTIIYEFIGGEPLLEIDLIKEILTYTLNQMIKLHHPWLPHFKASICSNGVLYFQPKIQQFIQNYHQWIGLSISIDGNKELHDSCRIDFNGIGSYDKAIAAVKDYYNKYKTQPNTKMTLAPSNISFLYDAIISLINNNYTLIPLNCIFENVWTIKDAKILYYQLKKIADYLIDNDLFNKVNISMFNKQYYQPMSIFDNENWCGGTLCDRSIAIDYKGDIFPCIRYMESSLNNRQTPYIIGTVQQGLIQTQLEKQHYHILNKINRFSQSSLKCYFCSIAKGCSWCSAFNYEETGTPNKRLTYTCIMHQATALANIYYWNKLYDKLNLNQYFPIYLSKRKILKIIPNEEFLILKNLYKNNKRRIKNGK